MKKAFFEWFFNGNFLETSAVEFVKNLENSIKNRVNFLHPSEINQPKICILQENIQYSHEIELRDFENCLEKNSAIEVFWQGNPADIKEMLIFKIFDRIFMDPCFESLRTQQQLGYALMRFS